MGSRNRHALTVQTREFPTVLSGREDNKSQPSKQTRQLPTLLPIATPLALALQERPGCATSRSSDASLSTRHLRESRRESPQDS
jgi:hypothetical protein